jgi:hypothetical protein
MHLLEVRVFQCLSGAEPRSRVVRQEAHHQVQACVRQVRELLPEHMRVWRGDAEALCERERRKAGPRVVRRRAEELEDHPKELDLRLRLEERLLEHQLGEDAPDRPHVDLGRVFCCAEQDLRCTCEE